MGIKIGHVMCVNQKKILLYKALETEEHSTENIENFNHEQRKLKVLS